jgi:hypothetical protein
MKSNIICIRCSKEMCGLSSQTQNNKIWKTFHCIKCTNAVILKEESY